MERLPQSLHKRQKPFLTVAEVAEAVGRSEYTIRRWIAAHRLPATRLPRPQVKEGLARKRRLWHHPGRNRLLVRIARLLGSNLPSRKLPWGLARLADGAMGQGTCPLRVAILVEAPEQGRALQAFLPDWPLRSAGDMAAPGAQEIVTHLAAGERPTTAAIILRADGGAGPLPRQMVWPSAGTPPRVALVDCLDAGVWFPLTQSRRHAYECAGWTNHPAVD